MLYLGRNDGLDSSPCVILHLEEIRLVGICISCHHSSVSASQCFLQLQPILQVIILLFLLLFWQSYSSSAKFQSNVKPPYGFYFRHREDNWVFLQSDENVLFLQVYISLMHLVFTFHLRNQSHGNTIFFPFVKLNKWHFSL